MSWFLAADCSANPTLLGCAQQVSGQHASSIGDVIHKGVNLFTFVIAAVAVIMIIIGGLRYTLSAGNPQSTKAAKDTIIYAIIGLVLAASAYFIVNYVIGAIIK